MTVTINGERSDIPDGLNVAALLDHLGMSSGRVAIERNEQVIPRDTWKQALIEDGDRLELVTFVGGGA